MKWYNGLMLLLAIIAIIVAFTTPEIRTYLGLDKPHDGSIQTLSMGKKGNHESPVGNRSENTPPNDYESNQSGEQLPSQTTQSKSQSYYPELKNIRSKEDDYISYINSSLKRANASVIIVDGNGNVLTPASSAIANIYKKAGKSASIGLLNSSFTKKHEFQQLCEGNSQIIQKLNLSSYFDFTTFSSMKRNPDN